MSIALAPISAKPVKLSQTGSFINWMESHNQTLPEVGKGATKYMWSDRHAYFVNKVSSDYKRVTLENAKPVYRQDDCKYTMEAYPVSYERTGEEFEIVFRHGSWKIEREVAVFKPAIEKMINEAWDALGNPDYASEEAQAARAKYDAIREWLYPNGEKRESLTIKKKEYQKINIGFGVMNAYYDPSF